MGDIYDRVCKFEDWSEDIKHEKIRIYDHIVNAGDFYKTRYNIKPMLLTDQYTNIIHPVKYGFLEQTHSGIGMMLTRKILFILMMSLNTGG